jgi:hypothetical protein
MPNHLATPTRRHRAGSLLIAVGLAVAVLALVDGDPQPGTTIDAGAGASTSAPTVLGAVITRGIEAPLAEPAEPATFELPAGSTRPAGRSAGTPSADTTPPPTLGPAWSIVNPDPAPDDPTSTTEATTATTEASTTPPPGEPQSP